MKLLLRISILAAMLLISSPMLGGDGDTDQRFNIDFSMSGAGSNGDYLPLFLTTNQFGVYSPEGDQFLIRPTAHYWLKRHNFRLEAVADLVAYASTEKEYYTHNLHLQQLYARAMWKNYFITVGMEEQKSHLVEHTLSSGNMVISNNARPAVGLRGGTKGYIRMRVLDEKVEAHVSGFMGRLTDGSYNESVYHRYEANYGEEGINDTRRHGGSRASNLVQNAWIHYAAFMLRSQSDLPFYITLGVEHAAMYGGQVNGVNQNNFGDHFLVALGGKGKGQYQYNHLIAFDGKAKYKRKRWSTSVYRQIYADDLDGNAFRCGMDGLTGIELRFHRKPFFKLLVFEYLQTTRQGGVVYANDVYKWEKNPNPYSPHVYSTAGNSNFYHDECYGGWAHRGMALGNPLLASPIYNKDGYNDFTMNVVRAFNFGMMGRFVEDFSYRFRYCFSKTWGTPYYPIGELAYNNSANLDLQYDWGLWQFIARVAYDHGQIYGNQWGYSFTVTHIGEIFNW